MQLNVRHLVSQRVPRRVHPHGHNQVFLIGHIQDTLGRYYIIQLMSRITVHRVKVGNDAEDDETEGDEFGEFVEYTVRDLTINKPAASEFHSSQQGVAISAMHDNRFISIHVKALGNELRCLKILTRVENR